MKWEAEAPVSWPGDPDWQRAWTKWLHEMESWDFSSSGELLGDGSPRVLLTQGSHLGSGAVYRVGGDTLTLGEIVASIEGGSRTFRLSCVPAPHLQDERVELTAHDLDRLERVELVSTLPNLGVRARLEPRPETLLSSSVDLPWLTARLDVSVDGPENDVLRGVLDIAGAGLWRPVLAPFIAAARAQIEEAFRAVVDGVSEALAELPAGGTHLASPLRSRDPAAVERRIRTGMAELARRLHAVEQSLSDVPWWRRDAARWREAYEALGPGAWPPDSALFLQEWTVLDSSAAAQVAATARWRRRWSIDRVVKGLLEHHLRSRRTFDEEMRKSTEKQAGASPAGSRAWPTDDDLDLDWLATPWSTIRKLTGVATDAEAQTLLAQTVAGQTVAGQTVAGQTPTVS